MMFDSYTVCIEYILKTDSWGFFPEWVAEKFGKKLEKVVIDRDWQASYNIKAIWNKNKVFPKALTQYLEGLEDIF